MGYLNNIFNSLRVISEGDNYSTTGFTVTYSGTGLPGLDNTSFMVRDGGYVGIGTNLPKDGLGGNANLHVVGNARVTNIPTGGKNYLTTDVFGNILQNTSTPIIPTISGDCVITSAYTAGISGCTLYLITSCTGNTAPGRLLVNGYVSYTADTCGDFIGEASPYRYGLGAGAIEPKLNSNNATSPLSSIGGGQFNNTIGGSAYSRVGGGLSNLVQNDSVFSSILGGSANQVNFSSYSNVGGGFGNKVLSSSHSSIVGGMVNIITGTSYAAIVNGVGNTVRHQNSVIIGMLGGLSDDTYTTYVSGLNVDSGANAKYFKYHGALANPGPGKILVDSTGAGDAVWQQNPTPGITFTGDCAVMSAYTVNCTLYMVTDCTGATGTQHIMVGGNVVYTANTCNSFNSGPYQFGLNSAIEPVLGGNNADGFRANIGGGQGNTVDAASQWSTIGNGVSNTITNTRLGSILGGQQNTINIAGWNSGYGVIVNGFQNTVNHQYSVIMGGANITTDRDFTVFMRGLDVSTTEPDPLGPTGEYPFRYHGIFANEAAGRILTSDASGNASWQNGSSFGPWTGDCGVVSAYTEGCLLYMMTDCTGTTVGSITVNGYVTYTADTCGTFGGVSPYEYADGGTCSLNSIRPVLGSNIVSATTSNITGGFLQKILGCNTTYYTEIGGGGYRNTINSSTSYSTILGGAFNKMGLTTVPHTTPQTSAVVLSTIVGGGGHRISGATYSSILGGNYNRILGTDSTFVQYAAIINGNNNIVKHDGSVIMNGPSFTSDDTYTTYTRGLNVNSLNSIGGPKYFKYHGALANPGFGSVLVDSTGAGDAVWAPGGIYAFSGDQYVTSAYTTGCTLFITTNSGNTFTADTCGTFGGVSPYMYKGGSLSISTRLPAANTTNENYNGIGTTYSSIGGGKRNSIITLDGQNNTICAGYYNEIGPKRDITNSTQYGNLSTYNNFIGAGQNNKIRGGEIWPIGAAINNVIVGGSSNIVTGTSASSIVGGVSNEIWGTTHVLSAGFTNNSFIGGGASNIIKPDAGTNISILGGVKNEIHNSKSGVNSYLGLSTNSTILGGRRNVISASTYSSIVNGTGNTITQNYKGTPHYASIINGRNNRIQGPLPSVVILGGDGIVAATSHTTHTNGLNVDTDTVIGTRTFRYHGTYAAEGAGKILVSDAIGNASWQNAGWLPGLTGDCVVSTAYTINCTLYMITNCTGATAPGRLLVDGHFAYTADTCQTFGGVSPYKYGMTTGSIDTTLPLSNNIANGGWFDVISGGRDNRTTLAFHSGIQAGYGNVMSGAVQTFIGAGKLNRAVYHEDGAIVAGIGNYLGTINKTPGGPSAPGLDDLKNSFIGAGAYNEILKSEESSLVGGQYNLLRETYQSFIGGGDHNILTGDSASVVVGGYYNTMKSVQKGFIGGGAQHFMEGGLYNGLVGGYTNTINNNSSYSFIGGGISNTIGDTSGSLWSQFSSILGGRSNKIQGDGNAYYAAIVNGQSNTVTADYAAIIGGQSLTANRTHTTFMNGLDVDVASSSGTRYLRYHGVGSNVGTAGDVLTSINASGDAIWSTPTAPGATWTGDCAVVSAFTTGCTLFMMTNCTGGTGSGYIMIGDSVTYTANTCNSQGTGPYRFGGNNGIEPILGGNNGDGFRASIGGGQNNTVDAASAWSNVGAGVTNTITDSRVSSILGGHQNTINIPGIGSGYGAIINGYQNQVTHQYSVVMGGSGIVSDKSFTTFMNGLDVDTNATGANRYFRYHGTLANPGFGKVLVDSTGAGDAVWADGGVYTFSGDQYVISAYTSGCTLHIVTNSGNTFTADTCNTTSGPYEWRGGMNSISTTLTTSNTIDLNGWSSSILAGQSNKISNGNVNSAILAGAGNVLYGSPIQQPYNVGSWIGGGNGNFISGSTFGLIGGGYYNKLISTTGGIPDSAIVAGKYNIVERRPGAYSDSGENLIGGGAYNTITNSQYSTIVAGTRNVMYNSGTSPLYYGGGFIGAGSGNTIGSALAGTIGCSILGGASNTIASDGVVQYSAIVNGRNNTVGNSYSAIIGGQNILASQSHTTYTNGLNADTDSVGGTRPFRYHGTYANPGNGKVLTSDWSGNASWQDQGSMSFTGDQYVVSAYTTGCTLFITTNSGNTFTANTCNQFTDSPYEYRGVNSISTKLPGSGIAGDNYVLSTVPWSNIGGGAYNKLNTSGPGYSNIAGGYDNTIGGADIGFKVGYSGYDFIGGGRHNKITGTDSFYQSIVGGANNWVLNSTGSFIGGGFQNMMTGSSYSFIGGGVHNELYGSGEHLSLIVGGSYNTIYSDFSSIVGGINNTIGSPIGGTTEFAGIFNGSGNTIGRNAIYTAIIGSRGINASDSETTYMKGLNANTNGYDGTDRPFKYHGTYANHGTAGYVLTAADALGNAHWQPGSGIPATGGDEVVISADTSGCTITFFTNSGNTFTADTCTGGYSPYRPTGTNSIVPTLPAIGQLNENIISANSDWSSIGGGSNNRITQTSDRSVIAGGQANRIIDDSYWSNISGGVNNEIKDSSVSSILGGHQNEIHIPGAGSGYGAIVAGYSNEVTGAYSTIVNGYNNTASQNYTTILNGVGVTTNLSFMAYIKGGLNIDTQSSTPRHFRYHGTLANEGAGRILTSDANGNATWQNSGRGSYSGDQYVVSAYTTGCTLFMTTNSGTTITANTCNTFTEGPYQYDVGTNNIVPKLPSLPGWKNTIGVGSINSAICSGLDNNIDGKYANTITGGWYNDIGTNHSWGSIVGGYANKLSGNYWLSQCTSIVGGWNNEIYNHQRSFIAGGKDNLIYKSTTHAGIDGHSSIIGGTANNISGATHGSIIGGQNHVLRSEANYSVILGGGSAITGSTPSTTYMTNSQTMGKARIASNNYLSTNGLHNQSPKTALDVVHDTDDFIALANNTGGGEIVRFGSTGGDYAAGYLVQLQAGTWVKADAQDASYQGNMLGIALGATPEKGILIRGHYVIQTAYEYTGTESVGEPLYVSFTDGMIRNVVPTTAGQYVRAVGYTERIHSAMESVLIYFNPDSTYITLT